MMDPLLFLSLAERKKERSPRYDGGGGGAMSRKVAGLYHRKRICKYQLLVTKSLQIGRRYPCPLI
jgi:hypothetical protein